MGVNLVIVVLCYFLHHLLLVNKVLLVDFDAVLLQFGQQLLDDVVLFVVSLLVLHDGLVELLLLVTRCACRGLPGSLIPCLLYLSSTLKLKLPLKVHYLPVEDLYFLLVSLTFLSHFLPDVIIFLSLHFVNSQIPFFNLWVQHAWRNVRHPVWSFFQRFPSLSKLISC